MAQGDDERSEGGGGASTPPLARLLRRVDDALGTVEAAAALASLLMLVLVGTWAFIASKLLDQNDTWPIELVRYGVFFVALSGAALAAQKSQMINMDVVTRLMKPRSRAMLRIVTSLLAAAASVLLLWAGLDVRATPAAAASTYDFIPAPIGLIALPLFAGLIAFHFVNHALIDAAYLASGQEPPEAEKKAH